MSVQFGTWNCEGKPVEPEYLGRVKGLLAAYGPDGCGSFCKSNLAMLYQAFHTTKESRRETQPHASHSGAIITWDGRLDNRSELIHQLADVLTTEATDVEIVATTYDKWGEGCFAKLAGDWALSIWNAIDRSLILSRDSIGARPLYYSFDECQVSWSTVLDPLILLADKKLPLCEEYIAGWLSFFPASHLTPYVGIHSVPPSSFVRVRAGMHEVRKYWDFNPNRRIHYRTDGEYEEHFRTVFAEAIRRRLRSDSPVLAELSGGIDSSSIVCMADRIIAAGVSETPRLDTVSYYNDSEPNWNERPYFGKVEEKRGRAGCHIPVSSEESLDFDMDCDVFAATPGAAGRPTESDQQFAECVISCGSRVLLSGIGGDEVTGGLPTPVPELADLIARAQFWKLLHQLKEWALSKRKPCFRLLAESMRPFLPSALVSVPEHRRPPLWLRQAFAARYRLALAGYEPRWRLFGALPSFQEKLSTIDALRRQISCFVLSHRPLLEKSYPYLDRGLLEFLCAVPPQQLVRPKQRRSLMRRALVGIVPDEILNRRRKAYVARGPCIALATRWSKVTEMSRDMRSSTLGIINPKTFMKALEGVRVGRNTAVVPLLRVLVLEWWLKNLIRWDFECTGQKPRLAHELDGIADQVELTRSAGASLS